MKSILGVLFGLFCCSYAWADQSIDTAYFVKIGGIDQWLSIKGRDSGLPLCLWLHGGPGGSDMKYAGKFSNKLNKRFIFVEWDQRESGKTATANHSKNITLGQIHQDVSEVIIYLLHQYHRKKLVIMGNSWGGFLALTAASRYPELLEACILVSPSIYFSESENISLQYVKTESKERNDKIAQKEIASIRLPFETPKDLWLLRKWMYTFHGEKVSRTLPPEKIFLDIVSKWFTVIQEWEMYNPFTEIKRMDIPIFFILGKQDYITHCEIAQRFFDQLEANKKEIYWLDAGHMIITERPEQMQDIIIRKIFPSLAVE